MLVTKSFGKVLRSRNSNKNSRKKPIVKNAHQAHRRRVRQDLKEIKDLINSGVDPEELDFVHVQPDEMVTFADSPYF